MVDEVEGPTHLKEDRDHVGGGLPAESVGLEVGDQLPRERCPLPASLPLDLSLDERVEGIGVSVEQQEQDRVLDTLTEVAPKSTDVERLAPGDLHQP